jgi:tubulin-specific chaperone A
MADPRIKQLKIKTGVLKRVGKEKLSYRKEADQQKVKIEKMKDDGKDEHDIKKMGEVLQETLMMIPDCHRRLVAAHGEVSAMMETEVGDTDSLDNVCDTFTAQADLNVDGECEEFIAAEAQLKEAEEQMKVE